jgi:type IV secretion system protein VirB10
MNAPSTTPVDPQALEPAQAIEPPPEDINSIGARERGFPYLLFVAGAVVLVALMAVAAYWIKSTAPFATTKKEDYPTPAPIAEPSAAAPKLEIADTQAGADTAPTSTSPSPVVVPAPTPGKGPKPAGDGPCPVTVVIDKNTQRAVTDARGVPLTVDCKGVYSSTRVSSDVTKPVVVGAAGTPIDLAAVAPDRYAGEAILSRQQQPKDTRGLLPAMPQLPAPPVGAAEVLRQLQAIQSGQAQLGATPNPLPALPQPARPAGPPNTQGNPRDMLSTSKTEVTFAAKTINEDLVIPKGTQIDCGLTTRAITEISGFASCQITRDVYSANGRVLLIERMSVVDGEYAAQSQAGQRYIHVLWTRVRKPGGTTIEIASPATDGLGGAGIPAFIDNRWLERIGGAYFLSFIKDAIAYKTAVDSQTGQSAAAGIAYQNSIKTSEALAEKVLSNTIGIKPLLYANQGDRVAIYVARDLDFSKVYEVRAK